MLKHCCERIFTGIAQMDTASVESGLYLLEFLTRLTWNRCFRLTIEFLTSDTILIITQ